MLLASLGLSRTKMNTNEWQKEQAPGRLFENNLLAVDKYLATINTTDGKTGSFRWSTIYHRCGACAALLLRGRSPPPPHAAQILVHSYIQIHAQFFVQILVKLIAQILCTFSYPQMHVQHSCDTWETRRCMQQQTNASLVDGANL